MEPIDILAGINQIQDGKFLDLWWQRQLNQNPVALGRLIEVADQLAKFLRRGGNGQPVQVAFDANSLTGFLFVANVNLTGWILAHEDRIQSRRDTRFINELSDPLLDFALNLLGCCAAVK